MSGTADRLLYVGQSQNLRARLNSYKNLNPERISRRIVRLVHQVNSITWEVCASPEQAQLRENELLRLHKPKFNVANTRPEHYAFIGLQPLGRMLVFRLTKSPVAEPGERLYGAFKGIGGVRAALAALLRLGWTLNRQSISPYQIPSELIGGWPPERFVLDFGAGHWDDVHGGLDLFLSGKSDRFLEFVSANLPRRHSVCPVLVNLWQRDMDRLRDFYRFGPQRSRQLCERFDLGENVIGQAALDDLLVLQRQDFRIGDQTRPATLSKGHRQRTCIRNAPAAKPGLFPNVHRLAFSGT